MICEKNWLWGGLCIFLLESFYGAVKKLIFLKKLILILMFDSFLNCWLLINDQ